MIEAFDIEIDQVSQVTAARLRADPGYLAGSGSRGHCSPRLPQIPA